VVLSMHEYDLLEIKREIVESRSLSIRTNNLVSALSADVKSISKRQLGYERRMVLHSTAAYVITILVVLGLSKVALDAQVASVRAEAHDQKSRISELETQLRTTEKRYEKRDTGAREALGAYELVARGNEKLLIEKLPGVLALELSPVERRLFEDAGHKARQSLATTSYQVGIDHLNKSRFHEATIALRDAIELEYTAPTTPSAMYHLAQAYRALGEQKKAIPLLLTLAEVSGNADILDEATLLLAECQVDAQLFSDAKATLRQFLRRFEKSPLRLDARTLLSELELKH
jgi:TolA-binding protein